LSPGYICDADYIDYFYDGLSPWFMDYLAALGGFPRLDTVDGFDYCELGCGTGLSLVIHAAANPPGRFVGVDLNPDHIRRAAATARAGQVANVTFLEEDFSQLLERELPRFDVIALHGVYSWVSPGIRREIQGFIAHRLKPGGKVYVSYNALPGWSQQIPVRQIMVTHVDGQGGSTLDRVAKGIEHLRRLRDAGAASVQTGPQVKALVEHILTADPRYVAHEYFTPFWEAYYFRQVHDDMARVGLSYVGCLPAAMNYGAFCLPRPLQDYFQGLPSRVAFETHKDLVLNTVFRRDVYCLGQGQPTREPTGRLAGVTLGSFKARPDFTFQFEAKANVVQLDGALFPRLADLLAGSRWPVEDLLAHPSLAGNGPEEIVQGLECLVASGQVLPCAPGPALVPDGLSPLNRHLLERDAGAGTGVSLACPGYGTGLALAQVDALIVLGLQEAGPEGVADWIQAWAGERRLELAAAGDTTPLAEQVRARARRLPLAALGLTAPAAGPSGPPLPPGA
jgi:SAM-dependent methyltransferase